MIGGIVDVKPKLVGIDRKPRMGGIELNTPRLSSVYDEVIRWQTTRRGMPIGLLLTLTYPDDKKL